MLIRLIDQYNEDPTVEFNKEDFQNIEVRCCKTDRNDHIKECRAEEAEFYGVYVRIKPAAHEGSKTLRPSMHIRDFLSDTRAHKLEEDLLCMIAASQGAVNEIPY